MSTFIQEILTDARNTFIFVNCSSKENQNNLQILGLIPYDDDLSRISIVTLKNQKINILEVLKEFAEKIQAREQARFKLYPLTLKNDLKQNYFYNDTSNLIIEKL